MNQKRYTDDMPDFDPNPEKALVSYFSSGMSPFPLILNWDWQTTVHHGFPAIHPIYLITVFLISTFVQKTNGYDDETNSNSFVGTAIAFLHTSSTSGTR